MFLPDEIAELEKCPAALRALIDYHGQRETEADAADYPVTARFHRDRRLSMAEIVKQMEAEVGDQ